MPDLTFRSAASADVPSVLAFWQAAAENADRPVDSPEALQRLIARDPESLVLAESGGELVGTIVIGYDGWRCHLYRLAVLPSARRQGIGQALLEHAEARFTAFGGTRADAMVLDGNADAHGLWTRAGYERQPEWSRWIKPLQR